MPRLTLNVEVLTVASFSTDAASPMIRPTLRTIEPGCTTPELCGGTVAI